MAKLTPEEIAQRDRERLAERSRKAFAAAAEVGEIKPPKDIDRRERCERNLLAFLVTYFPNSTGLAPFGPNQVRAILQLENAVLHGGRMLNMLPRGYCKSSISEGACLWAFLYGHRRFILFIGANDESASTGVESIKRELQDNPLLAEDFPEVITPILKLEGKTQRCASQTHNGQLTHIEWTADTIVAPVVEGSSASGTILRSAGLLAASRGARYLRSDGFRARPDLVVIDDPQTDQSALSPTETAKRLRIIKHSISRLGGHGRQSSIVINCTMIADNDLVDQLSDRKKHPGWKTIRGNTVVSMPIALESHWLKRYADILRNFNEEDVDGQREALKRATKYYLDNFDTMNEGAEVTWDHVPLEEGEVSALQHALNIYILEGEEVFDAECQNQPSRRDVATHLQITTRIAANLNGLQRGQALPLADARVFGIDVHDEIFYWSRAGVRSDFVGSTIDYGTWPQQPTSYFSHAKIKRKLTDVYKGVTVERAMFLGLVDLIKQLAESGPISCGLIDSSYKPKIVADAIKAAGVVNVRGSRGLPLGPANKPLAEYDLSKKRCRRKGPTDDNPRWYFPREFVRRVFFDANYWKDFGAARLTQELNPWSLWGDERQDHSLFIDQACAEKPIAMTANGRTVNCWRVVSHRDNHFFDTFIMCLVAASISGCMLEESTVTWKPKAKKKKRPRGAVSYF